MSSYDTQVGGDHYKDMKIQPSEFINKNKMQFAEGNAIKYICRHQKKGGKQDLEKAKHYIDMIIERDYGDDTYKSQTFEVSLPNDLSISYDDVETRQMRQPQLFETEDQYGNDIIQGPKLVKQKIRDKIESYVNFKKAKIR